MFPSKLSNPTGSYDDPVPKLVTLLNSLRNLERKCTVEDIFVEDREIDSNTQEEGFTYEKEYLIMVDALRSLDKKSVVDETLLTTSEKAILAEQMGEILRFAQTYHEYGSIAEDAQSRRQAKALANEEDSDGEDEVVFAMAFRRENPELLFESLFTSPLFDFFSYPGISAKLFTGEAEKMLKLCLALFQRTEQDAEDRICKESLRRTLACFLRFSPASIDLILEHHLTDSMREIFLMEILSIGRVQPQVYPHSLNVHLPALVQRCIAKGVGVYAPCEESPRSSVLHEACRHAVFPVIPLLCSVVPVNAREGETNRTPLHELCSSMASRGNFSTDVLQTLDRLLEAGADVSIKDSKHKMPLTMIVDGISIAFTNILSNPEQNIFDDALLAKLKTVFFFATGANNPLVHLSKKYNEAIADLTKELRKAERDSDLADEVPDLDRILTFIRRFLQMLQEARRANWTLEDFSNQPKFFRQSCCGFFSLAARNAEGKPRYEQAGVHRLPPELLCHTVSFLDASDMQTSTMKMGL